ncbi:MAG: LptF/LptG family permease [Bacteroidota bacterium]|nr:LptF/LptG family permease [Bacteroidota bacterium]
MIKVLDLYIAKKFIGTLIFIMLMTAMVSVIFDISEKIEDFTKNDATWQGIIFKYYVNFVPTILNLISPLIIFLSALYFTSRLANNTEFVAMLSGGISYYRLLVPYLAVALLLVGVDYSLKNYLIPHAYGKQLDFEMKYLQQGYNYTKVHIHRQLDEETFFYTHVYDFNNNIAYKFAIEKFEDRKLIYKLRANDATYDTISNRWKARDYVIRRIDGMKETVEKGDTISLKLSLTREDFGQKVKSIPTMTTPEMNRVIAQEKFRGEDLAAFYGIEKSKRTAMPVAIIILVVIAVSIATRKMRGGIGMHLMFGILIAISYELMMRFSTTFATNADLAPSVAVWLPNIIYSILAVVLLVRTPK